MRTDVDRFEPVSGGRSSDDVRLRMIRSDPKLGKTLGQRRRRVPLSSALCGGARDNRGAKVLGDRHGARWHWLDRFSGLRRVPVANPTAFGPARDARRQLMPVYGARRASNGRAQAAGPASSRLRRAPVSLLRVTELTFHDARPLPEPNPSDDAHARRSGNGGPANPSGRWPAGHDKPATVAKVAVARELTGGLWVVRQTHAEHCLTA